MFARRMYASQQLAPCAGHRAARAIDGVLEQVGADVVRLKLESDAASSTGHGVMPHHAHVTRAQDKRYVVGSQGGHAREEEEGSTRLGAGNRAFS